MFEKLIPNPAACYNKSAGQQQNAVATAMGFTPDMTSTITATGGEHPVVVLNILGYIPVVSTFSGAYRTVVGIAYFIKSAACSIFDVKDPTRHRQHLEGLKISVVTIGRGVLELVPIIGNLFVINIDVSRMMHRWSEHGHPYGDSNTIPIFSWIDAFGAIPFVGIIVNFVRAIFFIIHGIINIPPAIACIDASYFKAITFSGRQIGIGMLEWIPAIGTVSACMRHRSNLFGTSACRI
jgi:hypothetical protein